jgi:hypothetical protein
VSGPRNAIVIAAKIFISTGRIPLWVKLLYTAFVVVLVPVYLHDYGPTNFLFFCDVALLMTLVAIWWESSLWASAPLVGIMVAQLLWMLDFFVELAGAVSGQGWQLTGMTHYMFNYNNKLFLRGLSFFHFWLPWLLVYLVWKLGFHRRAFVTWTMLGWGLLFVCYFFMPAPPAPEDNKYLPVNINNVFGMSYDEEQTSMPRPLWFSLEVIILTFGIWLPTQWVMTKIFRPADAAG